MNRNLWLLVLCQGLFLTNNVAFIAINGLVGLQLAPFGWMATLPVMGYVVGGAISAPLVAKTQTLYGRAVSFQIGLGIAAISSAMAAFAVVQHNFWLVVLATVIAGYYNANGQLYRFAAAELTESSMREKAVSLVLAGGLLGAIAGPMLAARSRTMMDTPFEGAYVALAVIAVLGMLLMAFIRFPEQKQATKAGESSRTLLEIMRQPVFLVACIGASLGYGVMNLLMAATPLAMQQCGLSFYDSTVVLQWHVIGMFAPGFFTGNLIKRFGTLNVMFVGVLLNLACIVVALGGLELQRFEVALFLLGVGWNFLFTGSTTLSLAAYRPEEKDRAQAAINFCVFAVMTVTSFASGALVTTQGWYLLNIGSLIPVVLTGLALLWMGLMQKTGAPKIAG